MYKSKQSGRGRYHFFDVSLNRVSIEKFDLEQRMPAAIEKGEFVLHYQPKSGCRITGLWGWKHWSAGSILTTSWCFLLILLKLPKKPD